MKKVDISTLIPGMVASQDYFSDRRELLISRGVQITARHIEMLKRRNIFEVLIQPDREEEELERILSAGIKSLGKLDIEHEPEKPGAPRALSLPGLRGIKQGKDGLSQLAESDISLRLDSKFTSRTPDTPAGVALSKRAVQVSAAERTAESKLEVSRAYERALQDITRILTILADGNPVSGMEIHDIVKRFVRIFITDRNILLNISGKKHAGFNYLFHHSLNVCLLAVNIAASEGYSEEQVIEVGMGALLHDVGMFLVPMEIIASGKRLGAEDWFEVMKHSIMALHLLERIDQLPESVPFVAYQIHERENRTGYPKQRGSNLIHNFARIVQVADVYEAMSSPRIYRPAFIPYKAMENVVKMTRKGLLAGNFVEAFLRYASLFPVGSLVQLSDKRIAKVVDANQSAFAKPVVSILTDSQGKLLEKVKIFQVDIASHVGLSIATALPSNYLAGVDIMDGF